VTRTSASDACRDFSAAEYAEYAEGTINGTVALSMPSS
jgi:hypothetical protein